MARTFFAPVLFLVVLVASCQPDPPTAFSDGGPQSGVNETTVRGQVRFWVTDFPAVGLAVHSHLESTSTDSEGRFTIRVPATSPTFIGIAGGTPLSDNLVIGVCDSRDFQTVAIHSLDVPNAEAPSYWVAGVSDDSDIEILDAFAYYSRDGFTAGTGEAQVWISHGRDEGFPLEIPLPSNVDYWNVVVHTKASDSAWVFAGFAEGDGAPPELVLFDRTEIEFQTVPVVVTPAPGVRLLEFRQRFGTSNAGFPIFNRMGEDATGGLAVELAHPPDDRLTFIYANTIWEEGLRRDQSVKRYSWEGDDLAVDLGALPFSPLRLTEENASGPGWLPEVVLPLDEPPFEISRIDLVAGFDSSLGDERRVEIRFPGACLPSRFQFPPWFLGDAPDEADIVVQQRVLGVDGDEVFSTLRVPRD